ncbi:MAG: hypothetical protein M3Y03_05870, partial [Verrucomicrobiota bacterium]|nr:hypothetical protein [Verrucomicrobiota bacterium]
MPITPRSILLTAGDVSGDVHTAALARALLERDPTLKLHVLGGARLREVVAESPNSTFLGDTSHCSAIGILSAVKIYFRCRQLRARLLEFLKTHHIDAAVLCDWGAFNGHLMPELKTRRIPILYYFPPRSWQRSGSSGLGILPYVNRVATPFSWSAERLRAAGGRAEWVGHPSIENAHSSEERAALRRKFGVGSEETLVALLPGSRRSELSVLAPRMTQTAEVMNAQRAVRFIAVVPRELAGEARQHFPPSIGVVVDCASELLVAADAAVVKTGTACLEAVLARTPHVAVYDVSVAGRAEWALLWAWKRIPFFAMPNIILERGAVPELIGLHCRPERIAAELNRLLDDPEVRAQAARDFAQVRQALGSELPVPPTERTAQILEEMLRETSVQPVPAQAAV